MDAQSGHDLRKAAHGGHESCVRELLVAGADPNAVNNYGRTSLHGAARSGYEACVTTLIAAGADPNVVDVKGNTPLHWAARRGHRECAKILIVRILADRTLTNDEWDLVPVDSDIGHCLPVVMTRDGRDAAAKLVSKLPAEKQKVLETVAMCLNRFVLRDVVEQILVRCV